MLFVPFDADREIKSLKNSDQADVISENQRKASWLWLKKKSNMQWKKIKSAVVATISMLLSDWVLSGFKSWFDFLQKTLIFYLNKK